MTTLIQVQTNDGIFGRCDARCYDAKHSTCRCVCGGKNHGEGLQSAIINTREISKSLIEGYTKSKGISDFEVLLGVDVIRQGMFE